MRGTEKKIGLIILAAGNSSRLGQPKQLLKFKGRTLIRRAAETALETKAETIVVVLGANFEAIKKEIEDLDCAIVFNEKWNAGMSSSLKVGLERLLEIAPGISGAIVSLCDQPLIRKEHFDELIEKFFQTNKPIVSAFYDEQFGVPALFSAEKFSGLMNLKGDRGARKILNDDSEKIEKIELREAAFDVDTFEDFEKLSAFSKEISR